MTLYIYDALILHLHLWMYFLGIEPTTFAMLYYIHQTLKNKLNVYSINKLLE